MKPLPIKLNVAFALAGDELVHHVAGRVLYSMDVSIWHPQIPHMKQLMRNKRERNDIDAYRYNARDYLLLADALIQESLQTVVHDLESKMRQLGSYAGMTVMMAVLLSYWSLSTGLIVAVSAVLPLCIWSFRLSRKCSAIRVFMSWLDTDFENRLDGLCAAAFSQNEIGKGDQ
jgi:hypothetical protein